MSIPQQELDAHIAARADTWAGRSAPLVPITLKRTVCDVYPCLARIFERGWALAGGAALWLALDKPQWFPSDFDFYLNEGCDAEETLERTLADLRIIAGFEGGDISIQGTTGIVDVQLRVPAAYNDLMCMRERYMRIGIQFILAQTPSLDYLLYNFDTPVTSIAITDPRSHSAVATPLAVVCIAKSIHPITPDLIDTFSGRRAIKYFCRGFSLQFSHPAIPFQLELTKLLRMYGATADGLVWKKQDPREVVQPQVVFGDCGCEYPWTQEHFMEWYKFNFANNWRRRREIYNDLKDGETLQLMLRFRSYRLFMCKLPASTSSKRARTD
jgi:hypothetical protein